MHPDVTKILYTRERIDTFVQGMGASITRDYADKDLVIVAVLKGATLFTADLVRAINLPLEMGFMAVSSYGAGVQSSGTVRIAYDLSTKIAGRDVLVAEDVVDSGLTLRFVLEQLAARQPRSLEVAALFEKIGAQKEAVDCRYRGLPIPDEFVVGCGLDYAEQYRNLPYLGVLDPRVYGK